MILLLVKKIYDYILGLPRRQSQKIIKEKRPGDFFHYTNEHRGNKYFYLRVR